MEILKIIDEMSRKMENALNILQKDLQGIRSGRISPHFFDPVVVEAYGDRVPLSRVATISIIDAKMVQIQVWDINLVKSVEKGISYAGLGINPSSEGKIIKITFPALSEERREELAKLAHKYGENSKIALRNVRRDIADEAKKSEKSKIISEDDLHSLLDKIQKKLDEYINKIDEKIAIKEKEIKQI